MEAALREPWSNGQFEANIPHLKFLKRQKYGKTSFELLHPGALNAA